MDSKGSADDDDLIGYVELSPCQVDVFRILCSSPAPEEIVWMIRYEIAEASIRRSMCLQESPRPWSELGFLDRARGKDGEGAPVAERENRLRGSRGSSERWKKARVVGAEEEGGNV